MPGAPRILMISPEAPYPLQGGGALRTASLLHYLARISRPDLVLFSESGRPALLPEGLVRSQRVIPLPRTSRSLPARIVRNALRAARGVPPLIDRVGGLQAELELALGDERWDVAVVEHFWCAPYVEFLKGRCNEVVLDAHNVESVLHRRAAEWSHGLVRAGHLRFAAASRRMEARLLPLFSLVLTASGEDAAKVREIAPLARTQVYPNAYPHAWHAGSPADQIRSGRSGLVVFSGNFEYHPNVDAVEFLVNEIWPEVRRRYPEARLRLVGKGDAAVRHLVGGDGSIETTGPVEDALSEIAAADLAIAPLRVGSGTRLKIIEAWAASRAVVATPLGAEGLRARDGENLRLAADAPGFARAIGELLDDAGLRARLGAAGRECFEEFYSWEAAWRTLDRGAQLSDSQGDTRCRLADILVKPDAFCR